MCELAKWGTFRIDPCIQFDIDEINSGIFDTPFGKFKTLSSCCGHNKYPLTIVIENKKNGRIFEWFTAIDLPKKFKNGRKNKRFYKKDANGFYYIPQLLEALLL